MKRNWDLIREVLIEHESLEPRGLLSYEAWVPGQEEKAAHARLLADAGYLTNSAGGFRSLTWSGYELLDSIRDDTVWNRVKERLAEKALDSAPTEIVRQVAVGIIKQFVGIGE